NVWAMQFVVGIVVFNLRPAVGKKYVSRPRTFPVYIVQFFFQQSAGEIQLHDALDLVVLQEVMADGVACFAESLDLAASIMLDALDAPVGIMVPPRSDLVACIVKPSLCHTAAVVIVVLPHAHGLSALVLVADRFHMFIVVVPERDRIA